MVAAPIVWHSQHANAYAWALVDTGNLGRVARILGLTLEL